MILSSATRAQVAAELGDDAAAPVNVRPYNLTEQRAIRDLDPNDIEALVQVDGMVTRVSNVTPDMRCACCSMLHGHARKLLLRPTCGVRAAAACLFAHCVSSGLRDCHLLPKSRRSCESTAWSRASAT
jgi:MCM OB domain